MRSASLHHLVLAVADDHLAEVGPGLARGVGGGKDFQEPLDLAHGVFRELLGVGEQHGGRGRAVLGLAQQIGGADFAVDAVVGDHQRLGRSREQVDADAAEQLALGLRHIGVAGTDDHVDRRDGLGAERHRRHGLHAAEHVDLVGAAEVHRRDDRRMRAALERRRAGDDAFDARDARGDDRHVRRGDHRIAPARHVAADRVHRDVAVAEDDAGQRLDLQVLHGVLLLLREVTDLGLGEPDVVEVSLGDLRNGLLDLGRRQAEILRLPIVELLRQLADGGVLLLVDLREDAFDGAAHGGVRGLDRAGVHPALEKASHELFLPFFSCDSIKKNRPPGQAS